VRSTAAGQKSDVRATATDATPRWASRRRNAIGAVNAYVRKSAGNATTAAMNLVKNPSPTSADPRTSRLMLPVSLADRIRNAAPRRTNSSQLSARLLRSAAMLAGVTAAIIAANAAPGALVTRRASRNTSSTESTPAMACGR
jgi:hypothetical protein